MLAFKNAFEALKEERFDYQTQLREFKELNRWNQPFEMPISIPLWWIMVAVVVVIGVGGLLGVQFYLRSRREVCRIIWLPITKEDNLGQLLIALGRKPIDALIGRLRKLFSLFPIGKGKRRVYSLLYIIMPSLLANGFFFQPLPRFLWIPFWYTILILYLVTVVGIVLFFRFRPCDFNVLILGLILPFLFPFIYVVVTIARASIVAVYLIIFFFRIFGPMFLYYSLLFTAISFLVNRIIKSRE